MEIRQIWVPALIARSFKLAAAKLGVTQLAFVRALIIDRDNETWQAFYWALNQAEEEKEK